MVFNKKVSMVFNKKVSMVFNKKVSMVFNKKVSMVFNKKVSMVFNVHRNHEAYYEQGEWAKGVWRWGKGESIYLSLHCRHQNDSCIKMGSDESHFNVSLIVRDKITRQYPQTTTYEEKREPKRIQTYVPLLTSRTPYS